MATDLNRLLESLCDAGVDFVIVGGFAAMLHGSSLVTRDLDVCAILTAGNLVKLREALRELNPRHRMSPGMPPFLEEPVDRAYRNLYLETEIGPVDILGSITGVGDFAEVRAASVEVELFGRTCKILSLDGLIRAKAALGREKDRLALKELRAIAEKSAGDSR